MAQQSLERISLEPGTRLFLEGDSGDKAYLVLAGTVEISKKVGEDETAVIAALGKGEIIGEMALIDDQPRAATARVSQHAQLMVITRDDMEARLAKTDPVVRQLLKTFVNRLRSVTSKAAERTPIIR